MDGDDNIYDINFSAYELAAKSNDWADQNYLHFDGETIAGIETADVALKRDGTVFQVKDLTENEQTIVSKASNLQSKLANLSFVEILGKSDKPEYKQSEPELKYSVLMKDGDSVSFTISKIAEKDEYILKPSNSEYYFKVAKHVFEGLHGFNRASLVEAKSETPEKVAIPSDKEQP